MGDSMPRGETEKCPHPFESVDEVPVVVMVDGERYQETTGIKCMDCETVIGTNI